MNSFFGSSQNTKTEKHTRTGRSNSKERHFSNRKEERFLDDGFNEPERESRETEDFHSAQSIASSAKPTKMFMYVKERNWTGVVRRCMGDDKREAATWIVDKNIDGSMRWKCLPLHQVRIKKKIKGIRNHQYIINQIVQNFPLNRNQGMRK